jgi:rhodanese-related sulfurtransferase
VDNLSTIREVTIILAAGIGISLIANHLSPLGIPLFGQWNQTEGVIRAQADNQSYESGIEIDNIDLAKKIYDRGGSTFVDARSAESYKHGHIKGALSLPVDEFDNLIDIFLDHHPVDQPLIVYCAGRSCEDSHRLAQMLRGLGYKQVSVMIDGYPGWEAGGFPIE